MLVEVAGAGGHHHLGNPRRVLWALGSESPGHVVGSTCNRHVVCDLTRMSRNVVGGVKVLERQVICALGQRVNVQLAQPAIADGPDG